MLVESNLNRNKSILELGCGTGQFAEMLNSYGYNHYLGLDFSEEAISRAKKRNPEMKFVNADIENDLLDFDYDTIVSLETMEHLKDDLKLIQSFPKKEIVITVPSFNDPAHVRYFKELKDATDHYSKVIDIEKAQKFSKWYMIKGVTK